MMNWRLLHSAALVGILLASHVVTGCSSVTMLRTREIKAVGTQVDSLRSELAVLSRRLDSIAAEQERLGRRLKADLGSTSSAVTEQSARVEGRLEEALYRLDLLISKSDKILSKKVVIEKRGIPGDSTGSGETEMVKTTYDVDLDRIYNTARSDFQRAEYKLAYESFKQVFEKAKEGELAENSLYWMGVCLTEANQPDKAAVVFQRVLDQFPHGKKACVVLTRQAELAQTAGKPEERKSKLQKILQLQQCSGTNEAGRAQEEILGTPSRIPQDSARAPEIDP